MQLVAKSRAACLSAVETYNRASALYREETFAILMINAWELLLKARVMREGGGKASALHELKLICPLLSGPKSLLFWIMKEFGNGQETQA